jgi:hypothetical protein
MAAPPWSSSGRVGFLDWAQLKADTVASFTDWLTSNGYPYSTAASRRVFLLRAEGLVLRGFQDQPGGNAGWRERRGLQCPGSGQAIVRLPCASRALAHGDRRHPLDELLHTAFSWRIFGLTPGDQQLAFADGANSNRVLGYSGALAATDVTSLAGLAQAGDRLTKLTVTFAFGSTDPDVGLSWPAPLTIGRSYTPPSISPAPMPAGMLSSTGFPADEGRGDFDRSGTAAHARRRLLF